MGVLKFFIAKTHPAIGRASLKEGADERLLSKTEKWGKLKDATLGRFRLDKFEAYFSTFRPKNDCSVLTTTGTSIYR